MDVGQGRPRFVCDICGKAFSTQSHLRQHNDYKHPPWWVLHPEVAVGRDGTVDSQATLSPSRGEGQIRLLSSWCRAVNLSINNVMSRNDPQVLQVLEKVLVQMVSQLHEAVAARVAPHLNGHRDAMELVRDIFQTAQQILGSHALVHV